MTVTDKKLSVEHSLLLLENFENPNMLFSHPFTQIRNKK